MKRSTIIIGALFIGTLGLISASVDEYTGDGVHTSLKSAGGPVNNTNAPGEKTCSGTKGTNACHSGNIADNTGPATTSITSSGGTWYVPGQTYTITCSITHATRTRFGFQCTARRLSNNTVGGNIVVTDATNTWLHPTNFAACTSCQYICHKLAGTYFNTTTGSWTFNWTAPSSNIGNVRFYACFNAANNSNDETGDEIYYTTLTLTPSAVGVNEQEIFSSYINVSPNPAKDFFNVEMNFEETQSYSADLFSLDGKFIQHCFDKEIPAGKNSETVSFNQTISKGVYLLKIISGDKMALKKILISD
jgi:hypothetical protein